MQEVLKDCVKYFGQANGMRIYADTLIVADNRKCSLDEAKRRVIGSIKRIKTAMAKAISYSEAIDMYEDQMDGRHYSVASVLSKQVAKIDQYNKSEKAEAEKIGQYIEQVKADQAKQDESVEITAQVKMFVETYKRDLSISKTKFLNLVMSTYAKGEPLTRGEVSRFVMSYVPKGVNYNDFLEVLYKHA